MATYVVRGGMAGVVNAGADQTDLRERFEERFQTQQDAVSRGRQLFRQLKPGGGVWVWEQLISDADQGLLNLFDSERFVARVGRDPETGAVSVSPDGIDLTKE